MKIFWVNRLIQDASPSSRIFPKVGCKQQEDWMVSGTMFLNWLSGWYVLEQLFLDSWLSSGIEKKWLCAWDITNETSRVVCCIFSDYCVFGEIHLGAGEGMVFS